MRGVSLLACLFAYVAAPINGIAASTDWASSDDDGVLQLFAPRLLFNNCAQVSVSPPFAHRIDGENSPDILEGLSELSQKEVESVLAEFGLLKEPDNAPPQGLLSVLIHVTSGDYTISATYSRAMLDPVTDEPVVMGVWDTDLVGLPLRHYGVEVEGSHRGDHGYIVYQVGKLTREFAKAYVLRNNQETCSN